MARMIVAEEEARRMQNIRDGIGCPHGREENGCYPCSLEEVGVKAATKRFSKEYANVKRDRSK